MRVKITRLVTVLLLIFSLNGIAFASTPQDDALKEDVSSQQVSQEKLETELIYENSIYEKQDVSVTEAVYNNKKKHLDRHEDKVKEETPEQGRQQRLSEIRENAKEPVIKSIDEEAIRAAEIKEFGKTLDEIAKESSQSGDISPQFTSDYDYYATANSTHRWITWKAKDKLNADGNSNWYYWANTYRSDLYKGSDDADLDGESNAWLYHFHDPNTNENYLGGSTSAADLCADHFDAAVDYWGVDTHKSMYELGKALHYLQDCNEPHHVTGQIAGASNHTTYEGYVNEVKDYYESTGKGYYGFASTPWQFCDEAAEYAEDWLNDVDDNNDQTNWDLATGSCLRRAQKTSTGLLGLFFKEVGEPASY